MALVTFIASPGTKLEAGHYFMKTDSIPYCIIAAALAAAAIAGATFPGYYSTAWGILAGGLTVLGVSIAQAVAYDEGKNDEREGEE